MKKLLSVFLVFLMLLSGVTIISSAEGELPFELTAPQNVYAKWLEGGDSPTTVQFAYSLTNEMTAFFKDRDEAAINGTIDSFMSKYDYDEIWMSCQIDWAIDDVQDPVSGWHYTQYWDGSSERSIGYDDDWHIRVSAWDETDVWLNNATETVQEAWILRGVTTSSFYGDPEQNTPGIKDQLRPDQYSYDEGEERLAIDFSEHTAYFRARFVVTTRDENVDKYYYSDWSNVCSVGKNAELLEPLTKRDLKAPVITALRMTDKTFNDNPVVAFTLTVPDELAEMASRVAASGGAIYIETEARVKGDAEWTIMGNTDREVKAGELECALLSLVNSERTSIPADTEIELRCRYYCYQQGLDDIYSDYSKVISFGTDEISEGGSETTGETEESGENAAAKDKCPICGFCPRPLGLCIFIWLAIIAVIVVVIIIIAKSRGKNKKQS